MTTRTRRRIHAALAVFFGIQVPIALGWQLMSPKTFDQFWIQYLIFLSLYAVVATHIAGASAETPMDDENK